ncbi:MAG: ABC-F family ATP-binding cassette domain-containing protein [Balneolaceae bacterium]
MTFLSVENLSKSYGTKTLFEDITFGVSQGDKTALIAQNGTGKSTLLQIIAGQENQDSGKISTRNGIKIGFLEQDPDLDPTKTIDEFITGGTSEMMQAIQNYEDAIEKQAENFSEENQKLYEKAAAKMDTLDAWDVKQRMTTILSKLDINHLDQSISSLSGGERKRVALAFVLLDNPDFLIMDEPTNHLDVEMIEWLESYLAKSNTTLLMVTHDRYFLDRVCNHIVEMEGGKLYNHKGNYEYFLLKKAEREEVERKEVAKAGQLYKKELDWMRRQPKARTTKSKDRIDRFYDTEKRANDQPDEAEMQLDVNMARMGKKVIDVKNISKSYDDLVILDDFNYSFKRGERIGIIGKNGAGKSTFLKVLTGEESADSGNIDKGETIVFGHYKQQGIDLDESLRVIEALKEIAEVIELADGKKVSASQFLEYFLFDSNLQYAPISKLSGGEKRRLGLMMVLMRNPNFLILDEPTNDLDIATLQKLEEFLLNFGGCLIVVSHDRFFMDKLVQHYFVFEGDGQVDSHHGTYAEYREMKDDEIQESKKSRSETPSKTEKIKPVKETPLKKKLSFKEKKHYQKLEKEIEKLEAEKSRIEADLHSGKFNAEELTEKTQRYGEVEELLDEKTMEWIELDEKV